MNFIKIKIVKLKKLDMLEIDRTQLISNSNIRHVGKAYDFNISFKLDIKLKMLKNTCLHRSSIVLTKSMLKNAYT